MADPGGWRTSSRSAGGNCVAVRAWRKASTRSESGNCVEAAHGDGAVLVRDSTLDASPVLAFPAGAWGGFLGRLKAA